MDLEVFIRKHHRLVFYGAWFAMNIIQAAATELLDDEAYYWIYSNFLDWGYYDHPPMIALMIKSGTWILPGELGVRFMIVAVNTATLLVIQMLLAKKNPLLFYGILMSLAIAQVGGIIAAPDLPLMFFTATFFLLYQRFLEKMTLANSLLLGLNIALMLYSKYHGILIVFFTLLSNTKLFLRYQTWVAAATALIVFSPHIYWQYTHDFPSVKFHLVERNANSYEISFTLEYLLGQLLLVGPLMGWLFLWGACKHKPNSATEKALKYSMAGFYLFFLISTFKGRVEANWTVPVIVALIILSHQYLVEIPRMQDWVFRSVIFSLGLVLVFRIYLVLEVPGPAWIKKDEFHQNTVWAARIRGASDGLPFVSVNSYQKASKYWFYTGIQSYSLNTPDYRRNNFNYWPVSDSLLGKTVFAYGRLDSSVLKTPIRGKGKTIDGTAVIDSFFSFSKIEFDDIKVLKAGSDELSIECSVTVPQHYLPIFRQQPYQRASVQLAILQTDTVPNYYSSSFTVNEISRTRMQLQLNFPVKIRNGEYQARLATESRIRNHPTLNSSTFDVVIK